MRFLVAFRPGLISPSLAARMTATFDRLSNGRLLINVVTGGDPVELAGDGLFLEHDRRYELTDEFLEIWRALLPGAGEVNYEGKYLQVRGAKNLFRGIQQPYPALYFGGSSDVGVAVAAKHIDHYITWGEPPAQVATKIETVRKEVARWGRLVRGGAGTALVGSAETVAARMLEYLMSPTLTARMLASFDQMSEGRLLINVVTGGDPVELAGDGFLFDHDERYRLTDEFLTIFRKICARETIDFKGKYLEVRDAKLLFAGIQRPYPDLYLGGSSPGRARSGG